MAKAMTFGGMAVAGLSLLLFGLDLAIAFPFSRASWLMDVGFVLSGGILGYLSWSAFRDL